MRSNYRRMLDDLYDFIEAKFRAFQAYRIARRQLKYLHGGLRCRKEFRKIVVPFWKKYGIRPKYTWYRVLCAKDGAVDPRYIPESLWYSKIVPYYSNTRFRRPFEDKCMHGVFFADCKRPKTAAMNIAGVFYDENYKIISLDNAVARCMEMGDFLIKPSIDSGEGRLIRFFDKGDYSEADLRKAFSEFGCNFIAQQVIPQHPELKKLNPDSINTVRTISFLYKGEVHILSTVIRIGKEKSRVDNYGAGGYTCGIKDNGWLMPVAVKKNMERCTETHTGVKFADVRVPSLDKVYEIIKRKHESLGHFKLIGWDFGIDTDGDPVFIEYNVCPGPGPNQFAIGPILGDLTEEVMEDVFITKSLRGSGN